MTRIPALVAFGSICLVAPLFTGCATITRGTSEVLVVESEPSGATVRLSNGMVGTTPTSFKIPRKGAVTVSVFKEGFESSEINVNTQVASGGAAGMAGNVLVGGLIGVGVDSFSGGMLEHKPNPVKLTLVALAPKPTEKPAAVEPVAVPQEPTVVASAPPALEVPVAPESAPALVESTGSDEVSQAAVPPEPAVAADLPDGAETPPSTGTLSSDSVTTDTSMSADTGIPSETQATADEKS